MSESSDRVPVWINMNDGSRRICMWIKLEPEPFVVTEDSYKHSDRLLPYVVTAGNDSRKDAGV